MGRKEVGVFVWGLGRVSSFRTAALAHQAHDLIARDRGQFMNVFRFDSAMKFGRLLGREFVGGGALPQRLRQFIAFGRRRQRHRFLKDLLFGLCRYSDFAAPVCRPFGPSPFMGEGTVGSRRRLPKVGTHSGRAQARLKALRLPNLGHIHVPKPSALTFHLPSLGQPGSFILGPLSQPPDIMPTAARMPPLPGK